MDFKQKKENQIKTHFEQNENFAQFKEIHREDQEMVVSRLISETFAIQTEEVEFDQNKAYPAQTLVVAN